MSGPVNWRDAVCRHADPDLCRDRPGKGCSRAGARSSVASMALNLARGETFIAVFNAAVAFAAIPVGLPTVVTIRKALLRRRAAARAVQPAGASRAGATTP